MKVPKYVSLSTHTVLRGIREGLGYIWRENLLVLLLVNYGSLLFFGATYMILLPLFVVVILSANPVDLGLLYSAIGLSTIIGSLGLASLGDFKRKGFLLMASSILFLVVRNCIFFHAPYGSQLSCYSSLRARRPSQVPSLSRLFN